MNQNNKKIAKLIYRFLFYLKGDLFYKNIQIERIEMERQKGRHIDIQTGRQVDQERSPMTS